MLSGSGSIFYIINIAVNLKMNFTVINNEKESRFETDENKNISFLHYSISGHSISLLHTEVPDESGGKGVASALTEYAFKYAADNRLKVNIYCAFVAAYVKKHPDLKKMVQTNKD